MRKNRRGEGERGREPKSIDVVQATPRVIPSIKLWRPSETRFR